jgi:hypothetical protein
MPATGHPDNASLWSMAPFDDACNGNRQDLNFCIDPNHFSALAPD